MLSAAANALFLFAPFCVHLSAALETVDYIHDGVELQGFKTTPDNIAGTAPALVIIPYVENQFRNAPLTVSSFSLILICSDWDGVNDYERKRAEKVADELGYIGFAADIYGKDLHVVENITERIALANLYRNDPTLFANRIQAAVDAARGLDMVDGDKIAIAGYCFGGTGVLTYAMLGLNDVQAIVSFHGGLGSVPDTGDTDVTPKVLVLSGGSDDASSDIMDLEMNLDSVNADWEITRYSNIEHAFTVWDDDRYNEWVRFPGASWFVLIATLTLSL